MFRYAPEETHNFLNCLPFTDTIGGSTQSPENPTCRTSFGLHFNTCHIRGDPFRFSVQWWPEKSDTTKTIRYGKSRILKSSLFASTFDTIELLQHTIRRVYDQNGRPSYSDAGYWFRKLDRNTEKTIDSLTAPETPIPQEEMPLSNELPFGGVPAYTCRQVHTR